MDSFRNVGELSAGSTKEGRTLIVFDLCFYLWGLLGRPLPRRGNFDTRKESGIYFQPRAATRYLSCPR